MYRFMLLIAHFKILINYLAKNRIFLQLRGSNRYNAAITGTVRDPGACCTGSYAGKPEKTVFLAYFYNFADMTLECRNQGKNLIFMIFKLNVDWKMYKIQQFYKYVASAF